MSLPWMVGIGSRPASFRIVGAMSTELTRPPHRLPAWTRPGHRTIIGVRMPLS